MITIFEITVEVLLTDGTRMEEAFRVAVENGDGAYAFENLKAKLQEDPAGTMGSGRAKEIILKQLKIDSVAQYSFFDFLSPISPEPPISSLARKY
jgi:hypothetical protein